MFNYLKSAEVSTYTPRVSVLSGTEFMQSLIASRMIDEYCSRTLSIQHYDRDFRVNRSIVGYLPVTPIVNVDPVNLKTGLQLRPLAKTWAGTEEEIGIWIDINIPGMTIQPNGAVAAGQLSDLLNLRTGRLEVITWLFTDYNRLFYGRPLSDSRHAYAWLGHCEFLAGFFVDTTLAANGAQNATVIQLASVAGVVPGINLTFGDTLVGNPVQLYNVTAVNSATNQVTISPGLAAAQNIGVQVTQDPDPAVKVAAGQIIEDRLTFEPNASHQLETLDVLSTRLVRNSSMPLPQDAMRLLARYRNRYGAT